MFNVEKICNFIPDIDDIDLHFVLIDSSSFKHIQDLIYVPNLS